MREPLEPVMTRLSAPHYETLIRIAAARRTSVSELIRQIVVQRLPRAN